MYYDAFSGSDEYSSTNMHGKHRNSAWFKKWIVVLKYIGKMNICRM